MSQQFLGEIRMFGGNFPPRDWAYCDGRLLSIAQYSALFALIGTTYGGDGQSTFGVPDLRSRIPVGEGNGAGLTPRVTGEMAGTEEVTLLTTQLPTHSHVAMATAANGNIMGPAVNAVPAQPAGATSTLYAETGTAPVVPVAMSPSALGIAGGSNSHPNMMPSLCISFIIALTGIYPSRN